MIQVIFWSLLAIREVFWACEYAIVSEWARVTISAILFLVLIKVGQNDRTISATCGSNLINTLFLVMCFNAAMVVAMPDDTLVDRIWQWMREGRPIFTVTLTRHRRLPEADEELEKRMDAVYAQSYRNERRVPILKRGANSQSPNVV